MLRRRRSGFPNICGGKICGAVDIIAHFFQHFHLDQFHRSLLRAQIGEKVGDLFASLEIDNKVPFSGNHTGFQAELAFLVEEQNHVLSKPLCGTSKFQMIVFLGVCDGTAG